MKLGPKEPAFADHRSWWASPVWLGVALLVAAIIGVGLVSRYALLTVLLDGAAAAMVVVPAALGGIALLPLLRLGPLPLRWRLLLGVTLGLGVTAIAVLALGLAGLLDRQLWLIIVIGATFAGLLQLRTLLAGHKDATRRARANAPGARILLLVLIPFLSLALLAAAHAPGSLWQEEGWGYDALEYHLQLPKEYFQAGRIEYTPHNVYGNFPANVEMLYLLAMVLLDDDVDAGVPAQLIHTALALLTVFAAWVIGRDWSPRAGVAAAVAMGTCGWLPYLCGLAYVENGMLLFGLTGAGLVLRCIAPTGASPAQPSRSGAPANQPCRLRLLLLAGVMAGLACGCKYTAVPMVAIALAIAIVVSMAGTIKVRLAWAALFVAGVVAAFSPWLIKNTLMTGNPVFPLAGGLVHASPPGWGETQTQRWIAGHALSGDERTLRHRLGQFWQHIPADKHRRFGAILTFVAIVGLLFRPRDRADVMLLVLLIAQLAVWLFFTHLYARFAVVLLIPLSLLVGRAALAEERRVRAWAITAALVCGAVWNFMGAADLYRRDSQGVVPASLFHDGKMLGYEYFATINNDLPDDVKVLLVGDAKAFYFRKPVDYHVVFNRNPLAEAVGQADGETEVVAWLKTSGYTHVLVNYAEIRRLAASAYGFAPKINEALFDRLEAAGLRRLRDYSLPRDPRRYVTLYEVPSS